MSLININESFERKFGTINENSGDFADIINEDDIDATIPKDKLFNPDSVDFKDILRQRKAEADKKAADEAEAKRIAELKLKIKPILDKVDRADDKLQALFDELVPESGMADTVAGELVRAMMRIMYRDWNDGDIFYEGYGLNTCGPSAQFLIDSDVDLRSDFEGISGRTLTGDDYTNELQKISDKVVDYIIDNPDTMIDKNEIDSREYDCSELEENQPEYDLEISLPENVKAHLDNDDISYRDLQWEIGSWEVPYQGSLDDCSSEISVSSYGVSIYGLNRDAYDELDRELYKWLEQYGEDLDNDYGVPGEEDDDYDDETDEEVDESLIESYNPHYDEYKLVYSYDDKEEDESFENYDEALARFEKLKDIGATYIVLQGWSFSGEAGNSGYEEDFDVLKEYQKDDEIEESLNEETEFDKVMKVLNPNYVPKDEPEVEKPKKEDPHKDDPDSNFNKVKDVLSGMKSNK